MRNDTVISSFPFIHGESDEEDDADDEVGVDMWVAPFVGAACPI